MSQLTVTQTNGGTLTVSLAPAPALGIGSYASSTTVDPEGQLVFLPSGTDQPVLVGIAALAAYLGSGAPSASSIIAALGTVLAQPNAWIIGTDGAPLLSPVDGAQLMTVGP